MNLNTHFYYPWRKHNTFRLLIGGSDYFPVMENAIDSASAYVLLEIYLCESGKVADRFIEVLTNAVKRGVIVCVILDDFGSRSFEKKDRLKLVNEGVNLIFYNPLRLGKLQYNLFRDHRKILIVDGKSAFVGGTGIKDEFAPQAHEPAKWRETMVEISGEVVRDWQDLFEKVWNRWSKVPLHVSWLGPAKHNGFQLGRVVLNKSISHLEIKRSFLKHISVAERKIWITTPYFVPSRKIRRALRVAALKGIDVRLLLPGPITDLPPVRHAARRFYAKLLRDGIRIFEYQPRFIHTKSILCDNWVSVGSSNIDRWSFYWNLEANQEIEDQMFTLRVEDMFEEDFLNSTEIMAHDWHRRSWFKMVLEWFWGKVDILLIRIGRFRGKNKNRNRK